MTPIEALRMIQRNERLDQSTIELLVSEGYIRATDDTNHITPPGQHELLVIDITEKGQRLLAGLE